MQEFLLTITGIDPYMQHNDRLSNPLDPYKQAIASRTSLMNKSDDDHWWIARQEWEGGFRRDEVDGKFRVFIPTTQPFAAMLKAARAKKLGTTLEAAALIMAEDGSLRIPLVFDPPWPTKKTPPTAEALDLLWDAPDDKYRDMRMVNVENMGKRKKVLRTRPRFAPPWSARFVVAVDEKKLEYRKFEPIVIDAGRFHGIGERADGMRARFEVKIERKRSDS